MEQQYSLEELQSMSKKTLLKIAYDMYITKTYRNTCKLRSMKSLIEAILTNDFSETVKNRRETAEMVKREFDPKRIYTIAEMHNMKLVDIRHVIKSRGMNITIHRRPYRKHELMTMIMNTNVDNV